MSTLAPLYAKLDRYEAALREIGTPKSVPRHFDVNDWWRHRASKQGEIARDALGVTAEELIASRVQNGQTNQETH